MDFVDTHCHIQSAGLVVGERSTRELWAKEPQLSRDQLVANAVAEGVTKLICVGCDQPDSQLAIDFVAERPNCWATIGIHPHEAAQALSHENGLSEFAQLVTAAKVVAIGECGLDYFYEHSPRHDQITVLKFQLDLALQANLPVIFHAREAFDDFWPIFDTYKGQIRGVLHSFTDSQENLDRALERGLFIGVNGIVTFVKQPRQLKIYQNIPIGRLLLETDAPFLTPTPFRGTINEPKQITTVAAYLAQLRNESLATLATATSNNAHLLFEI